MELDVFLPHQRGAKIGLTLLRARRQDLRQATLLQPGHRSDAGSGTSAPKPEWRRAIPFGTAQSQVAGPMPQLLPDNIVILEQLISLLQPTQSLRFPLEGGARAGKPAVDHLVLNQSIKFMELLL